MKVAVTIVCLLVSYLGFSQKSEGNYRTKKLAVEDSIKLDSVSINPAYFSLKTKAGTLIDSSLFSIDFPTSILKLSSTLETDTIIVSYLPYPKFLTQTYRQLDSSVIVNNSQGLQRLYTLQNRERKRDFTPFDGLTTSGSISRGVTIGNNQNTVLNSELDLQISGKLSDKVTLKASIQDANIPLQESGYSQRLDEFDQVFIELQSEDWRIRAGDIDLVDTQSYFARFSKRVQGLLVNANLSEKITVFASGALVRGQFTTSQFTAQEGNQGPYKLLGPNGELFVLVVSGSEVVYVNGIPLTRGENEDYIIDYNAGEIIFNSTYPITSEMRITVDYQFSERNYSRFIAFGGGTFETEKLKLKASVYSESDAKNQPLQQNLSTEQVQILADAGDDRGQMVAPSAQQEDFSENRILYRKDFDGTTEIFVFSNNPEDELFSVRFSQVGQNQGNYIISTTDAVSTIYEYVAPIAGIPQGNFEPVIQLIAPERLQIAVVNGNYKPSEKTDIFFEASGSKEDLNLFSGLDDGNNDGFAGKLRWKQKLIQNDSLWNLTALADGDFINKNFKTIQRLYRAEFNRDWNLDMPLGNQLLLNTGFQLSHAKKGQASYNFEHLNFSENFNGNRHLLFANFNLKGWSVFSNSSYLNSESNINSSEFLRSFNRVVYGQKNKWAGTKVALESNEQKDKATNEFTPLSQRFISYEAFVGVGDSTAIFAEVGYKFRTNDSLRNNQIERVNTSDTYYVESKLIQSAKANLNLFANYRNLKFTDPEIEDQNSLNSRLSFNLKLFQNVLLSNTNYETNSGSLPQQEFTYVAVEPGRGAYTWNDYNNNRIQELDEFELAQFQDQGEFIRVLLPNRIFVRTHQNRFSQTLTFNPQPWAVSEDKTKKFWSHFYNQSSFLVDNKLRRTGNDFNLNPFEALGDVADDNPDRLGLNISLRNTLFFNRGKQNFTTSYTFLNNKTQNLLSIGFQKNNSVAHQFNFNHKLGANWLLTAISNFSTTENLNQNFANRDFDIKASEIQPKLSYLFSENAQFDVFYTFKNKSNEIGLLEALDQQNYGFSFNFNNAQKIGLIGAFNVFQNDYEGNPNSPVAYQILEGLQPGTNFTWNLLAQKRLTKYLDLNLSYFGRKSESSRTIHTGNVQLRAYF
ncbi:hypothetical protein Q2T40_17070 [Winogradskyella maritima]|uniref:Uncharacterized protein n=1 Tax=Winogradskyella maritima TaxID=1517766 RepID=A0ABV8AF89_9FLAO|nr:hypothetical protein [Winogradskyella maritima]